MRKILPALQCFGLRPDSFGHYLGGLGLLAALTQKWPNVRTCWRDGHLVVLGQGIERASVEEFFLTKWVPTKYERWWAEAQKKDTKAKSDASIQQGRAEASISKVRMLDAHIVGRGRNQFNPVFGSGGNIARRDLAAVAIDSISLLKWKNVAGKKEWLSHTLFADVETVLPELSSAGTWFVYANKAFNSGRNWHREGLLSPWSYLLALEGALLLTGGAGRRLGSQSRPYAAFPFVAEAQAPASGGELGTTRAEFWAPIWERPCHLGEVRVLFSRGLARIGERAAKAPHEFAIAARKSGADAGISSLLRFSLRQTTSSQTFEVIPRGRVELGTEIESESDVLVPLLDWLDSLPRDTKQPKRFYGLRGPVEETIVEIAECPSEPQRWRKLLRLLAEVQERIDCNKKLRSRCRAIPPLNQRWFEMAWPEPSSEILAARGIASIGMGTDVPLRTNIFGVTGNSRDIRFTEVRSQQVVWHAGASLMVLADLIARRLVDTKESDPLPLFSKFPCGLRTIESMLQTEMDIEEVVTWVPALSLLDWRTGDAKEPEPSIPLSGEFLLYALFRPLIYPWKIKFGERDLFPKHLLPKAAGARRLLWLIRANEWKLALDYARSRYRAAGHTVMSGVQGDGFDGERMAAALLLPVSPRTMMAGLQRLLLPKA